MKMFLLSFNAFKHRSIFAVFLAIFLLFGAVKGTKAQDSNGSASAFDGLENLVGISKADMMSKAEKGTLGEFPKDMSQIFFLYNVKTGLLLNVGGYWGTHVSLQEYGMPLWVYKDTDGWIHFQQDIDKQGASSGEGCSLEYFYKASNTGAAAVNNGVFVDRDIYASKSSSTVIQRGWTIEPISGDAKETFRIYTYRRNEDGYSKNTTYKRYYLSAASSVVDVDKNCGAFLETDKPNYSDDGSKWRIFSYEQLYNLQKNSIGFKSSLDLSFKLECPGFNRDNGALEKWKTAVYKQGATGSFRFGLEKRYKTDPSHGLNDYKGSVTSYIFNGTTYYNINDYQTHLGKYYCADIKNTRGAVYQVVHVDHGGSYVIECKAYSNTNKAKLFATFLQDRSEKPTDYTKIVEGSLRETVVMQTANMSQTEQTNLHISEQNMDYAGKEFYGSHKYFNSVLVQVPEGGGNICFGVRVGSVAENENVAKDGEWTVFDDFRLLYAGSTTSRDLILDEDKDNLNYLLHCTETYDDVVLHLNKKSFNKNINKWNTIVLPVDLNKDQFTQAFGANARLAKLTTLTRNQIQFETVKMNDKKDNEAVLEAYVPYIIYPTKNLANERTPAYTATLHKIGAGSELEEHKVTIAADHIDIPNVSLKKNGQNKNDLYGLDEKTWTLNLVKVANKTEASEIVTDGTLAAYGTFARTFGDIMENDEQTSFSITNKENPIIEGRDNLKGCYFFHEGKMVYAGDKVRGLRGFSVWFKPVETPASGTASSKFILDGIDYTTDVERIMATEDSSIDSKFAKLGVFNLNGQLVRTGSTDVSGLPSGIYIVNGKKVFVK